MAGRDEEQSPPASRRVETNEYAGSAKVGDDQSLSARAAARSRADGHESACWGGSGGEPHGDQVIDNTASGTSENLNILDSRYGRRNAPAQRGQALDGVEDHSSGRVRLEGEPCRARLTPSRHRSAYRLTHLRPPA